MAHEPDRETREGQAADDASSIDCEQEQAPRRSPLQFNLKALLVLTAVFGLIFGQLRWMGAPPMAGFLVLLVLAVSVGAAVGLVAVIASRSDDREERGDGPQDGDFL